MERDLNCFVHIKAKALTDKGKGKVKSQWSNAVT